MCRSRAERPDGKRCPCDTSEARTRRNHAARLRKQYAPLVAERTEVEVEDLIEQLEADLHSKENLISETANLNDELYKHFGEPRTAETDIAISRLTQQIGANVRTIAENHYDAPTVEEFLEVDARISEAVKADAAAGDAAYQADTRYRQYRESFIEDNNLRDYYYELMKDPLLGMEEMNEALFKNHPKEWEEYLNLKAERDELYNIKTSNAREAKAELNKLFARRTEAYRKALEDTGVEFAKPEDLKFTDTSDPDAASALQAGIIVYPKSWVEESNMTGPKLEITSTGRRASYSHGHQKKTREAYIPKPIISEGFYRDGYPEKPDIHDLDYEPVTSSQWINPLTGEEYDYGYSIRKYVSAGKEATTPEEFATLNPDVYLYIEKEQYKGKSIPKPETGYVKRTYYEYQSKRTEDGEWVRETIEKEGYFRPKRRYQTGKGARVGLLSVDYANASNASFGNTEPKLSISTAIHEFAHRCEATQGAALTRIQDAFLKDRAGLYTSNPEPLTKIYNTNKEKGYKDSFTNHYMGKVYENQHREILATGMEGVFAGEFGGLVGTEGKKADVGMLNFILGTLASSTTVNRHRLSPELVEEHTAKHYPRIS